MWRILLISMLLMMSAPTPDAADPGPQKSAILVIMGASIWVSKVF